MTARRKTKVPRLLQAVLTVAFFYVGFIVLFNVVLAQPIPTSLLTMYMFFVVAGVFMVTTFTDEGARELVAPIIALVEDPAKKTLRRIVFFFVPIGAGLFAYANLVPSFEAPVELRSIHPAPPASVLVAGQRYDLQTLENPFRKYETEDPERFAELVGAGADIYIRDCQYCHGDKLDGKGPYAQGLNPLPLNFQDIGTIAQLQESYLFWRIATGGPGLPDEGAPWISSMPAWQDFLGEDEIWKVILFLYDYTGHRPRVWE